MKSKEVLYAVIGGCFGAFITMLVGLFIPVGVVAQSQPTDAVFHTIQCKGIEVVDESGETRVRIRSGLFGGFVTVRGKEGKAVAELGINKYGGSVWLQGKTGNASAVMRSSDHGGEIAVCNSFGEKRVVIYVLDDHGFVDVKGLWPSVLARMSVDENGNGVVNTWDKNGYRQ